MPHLAHGHERHIGRPVGTGHCVALVRECSGLPATAAWRRGVPVRGGNCAPGTAIATFDPDGRYGNHMDLRSHAAILLSENSDGLLVCDQWVGQPCQQRVIRFRGGTGDAANDGDAFHVIELADERGA
jgi:hypothetical protein